MENIKQTFINDLSSYIPVGRQVVLVEEEAELKTKAGISLGVQKKLKLLKSGSTVEELELIPGLEYATYVILADHTPILSLTNGKNNYIQVDSAYIVGIEKIKYRGEPRVEFDSENAPIHRFDTEGIKIRR